MLQTVQELMTDEEELLFYSGEWGLAPERVARGVAFLDREVPDWKSRIVVKDLDLSSTCSCVVGQVFQEDALANETDFDGFDFYFRTYIRPEAETFEYDAGDAPAFFGFDAQWNPDNLTHVVGFTELQDEWTRVLQS